MKTVIAIIAAYNSFDPAAIINRQDIHCMARAVYHEARGEPNAGQSAVAHVILNRARAAQWPASICGVVYQPGQFSGLVRGLKPEDGKAWRKAIEISVMAYTGATGDPTRGALWYYAPAKVPAPYWASGLVKVADIGGHRFYGKAEYDKAQRAQN